MIGLRRLESGRLGDVLARAGSVVDHWFIKGRAAESSAIDGL